MFCYEKITNTERLEWIAQLVFELSCISKKLFNTKKIRRKYEENTNKTRKKYAKIRNLAACTN